MDVPASVQDEQKGFYEEVLRRLGKASTTRCGQAADVLSDELLHWCKACLGCVAGRREFASNRYFAIEVSDLGDVIGGWRHFVKALKRRETVACLYVIPDIDALAGDSSPLAQHGDAKAALRTVSETMSILSDQPVEELLNGGQLNFLLHLLCPVTGVRTAFFDFDAVAFVPQADDPVDALYDPLMAAPVPMVNINSDVYGFAMFTRDHALSRFDCEVIQLTKRERRYVFAHVADIWQRMAERTIGNYAAMVDQRLCPTYLMPNRD